MATARLASAQPSPTVEQAVNALPPEQAEIAAYWLDPVAWVRTVLGDALYDRQAEIFTAVRDYSRVAVVGCHSSGKDWASGRVVAWWMKTHDPAKVIIIGPTHRQVGEIVWHWTRHAYQRAAARGHDLGGTILETPRWKFDDESFALGFSTSDPQDIQGFHSPNLLAIITEAHNVEQGHIDAVKRLQPKCILLTGNAWSADGEFYEAFHANRDRWKTIQISAFDTPNLRAQREVVPGMTNAEWVADQAADYGEDSPAYQAGVLAQFPENIESSVVPLPWAQAAAQRDLPPAGDLQTSPRPSAILGVDIARLGDDKTVVIERRGDVAEIILRWAKNDIVQISGWLLSHARDNPDGGVFVIDADGLGAGVLDNVRYGLREFPNRWAAVEFRGGLPATRSDLYVNAIGEAWFRCRAWLDPARDMRAVLPNDAALLSQLASRRYTWDGKGRMVIESKDDLKKRGRRSPDEADALAMTFASTAALGGTVPGTGVYL